MMRTCFLRQTPTGAASCLALSAALLLCVPVVAKAGIQPGATAPDFALVDRDSTEVRLSDFRGQVVLLNFIGYNCQPCIQDAIGVEAIWQDFGDRKFQVLALDLWNGNVLNVQFFIDQTAVTFPVLRDAGFLSLDSQYGLNFDNFVIVDPEGIVRYTSENEAFDPFNDAAIRKVIEENLPNQVEHTNWTVIKGLYQ